MLGLGFLRLKLLKSVEYRTHRSGCLWLFSNEQKPRGIQRIRGHVVDIEWVCALHVSLGLISLEIFNHR